MRPGIDRVILEKVEEQDQKTGSLIVLQAKTSAEYKVVAANPTGYYKEGEHVLIPVNVGTDFHLNARQYRSIDERNVHCAV